MNRSRKMGRLHGCRGSALLTVVLFSTLTLSLLGTCLYLSSGEYRIATRAYLANACFNLAEGGLDLAIHALNTEDSSGWDTGTNSSGQNYWARTYSGYNFGRPITGEIKVVILDPTTPSPEVYSEGICQGHVAGDMKKQLYADLVGGFLPFENGFNTKDGILLKGNNITLDSYNSDLGFYDATTNRNSNITIATTSVKSDAVDVGNADIYGYVATGSTAPDVGPQGSITTYSNPGVVDDSRVTTDYYAEFPDVNPPILTSPETTLPPSGTLLGGDYLISSWSSDSSTPLYILGDTTIVCTGDMNLFGNGSIVIDPLATLTIYIEGDLHLTGNGIANTSLNPENLIIVGTASMPGQQDMSITGNGGLAAAVYAPYAAVSLDGGGSQSGETGRIFGAIAAYDADMVGNTHFSYDESLADFNLGLGGLVVEEWAELAGAALTSLQVNMGDYGL